MPRRLAEAELIARNIASCLRKTMITNGPPRLIMVHFESTKGREAEHCVDLVTAFESNIALICPEGGADDDGRE